MLRKLDDRPVPEVNRQSDFNDLGERREYQTGLLGDIDTHRVDPTDMLHSLASTNFDVNTPTAAPQRYVEKTDPASMALRRRVLAQLTALPDQVWYLITSYLDLADQAGLAMSCKLLFDKFAYDSFFALALPENNGEKLRFLHKLDIDFPHHLLCFQCGIYHARIQPGYESLKPDYVNHPVYFCPLVRTTVLPRTRIAHGRELPYAFVQLAVRAALFGPSYGIGVGAIGRRWRDPSSEWSHETRYHVHRGHLLLRVRSQVWIRHGLTPSDMRLLLFDRDEYTPYFSVCAHWRDGELTQLCKCVLSHVPKPPPSTAQKIKSAPGAALKGPPSRIQPGAASNAHLVASQCGFCTPGRRCPECPSEYVAKIVRAEDKNDPVERFKFMLVVIRWCDLGDGSGPLDSPEWASIHGFMEGYPSLEKVANRALMGIFEGATTGVPPGNRLQNMNPKNVKKGEEGNDWY